MWSETIYLPTHDQVALASAMGASLEALLPLSRLHQSQEESEENWSSLLDLGIFGIGVPEDRGGSGLGVVEEALIAMELGRCIVTPSVLATVGTVRTLLAGNLPLDISTYRVAVGYKVEDRVVFVQDSLANLLLIRSESNDRIYHYPEFSKTIEDQGWMVKLAELEVMKLGDPLIELSLDQTLSLRLIDAAALAGLAQAAIGMAVDYAGLREQFGRPIGSFQAIKHHCANMALAACCARDQVKFAAIALDSQREDAVLQVESAYFISASAAVDNAGKNIQIHGGIGFSHEAYPHIILKRAKLLTLITGGLEAAINRIGNVKIEL